MTRVLLCVALAAVICAPLTAEARSIPGAPNEVMDPWFIQYVEQGTATWYVNAPTGGFVPNPVGLPGFYFDPGRNPGDVGELRTIVDDTLGLWNPEYSQKEIDIFFYAHLDGDGYIDVRFDWWDDPSLPPPSNDPNDPGTPPPDGYSPWYRLTAADLGPFRVAPDLVLPGEDPSWMVPYSFHEIWDHQPRWVSIEIVCGIDPDSQIGGEALITGVDFEAQCIPEPATLSVLGLAGIALLARRRKA
ncbi:MAG: PEP-CTERM sorting domain-containing protein [Verrucomicrobia bacterium]|nr:PEP-CTERM sorting domain-containing protein [Verrucomicrobiota bacterium]